MHMHRSWPWTAIMLRVSRKWWIRILPRRLILLHLHLRLVHRPVILEEHFVVHHHHLLPSWIRLQPNIDPISGIRQRWTMITSSKSVFDSIRSKIFHHRECGIPPHRANQQKLSIINKREFFSSIETISRDIHSFSFLHFCQWTSQVTVIVVVVRIVLIIQKLILSFVCEIRNQRHCQTPPYHLHSPCKNKSISRLRLIIRFIEKSLRKIKSLRHSQKRNATSILFVLFGCPRI